jgi:FkbM family methyltransferase
MSFEPYVIDMGVRDFKFKVCTQEGRDWYDPIKPYTKLQYEWVLDNVDLTGNVIDCGARHGHYAVILAEGNLVCVDPFHHNLQVVRENMKLNKRKCQILEGAAGKAKGARRFDYCSNGRLTDDGNIEVSCYTIDGIMPDANVVKLDVEGAEFEIIPKAIDKLPDCHTWIVEVHPYNNHPGMIVQEFKNWELLKVNREKMIVEPYSEADTWPTHATIVARR